MSLKKLKSKVLMPYIGQQTMKNDLRNKNFIFHFVVGGDQ